MLDAKHKGSYHRAMNKLDSKARAQILHLLCEGNSIRAVTRLTGASKNTVSKLLIDAGHACAAFHDETVRGVRLHDLRHQFASHLVRARVPFPTVARLLGHADGGALVAKRYGRWPTPGMAGDSEQSRPAPGCPPL